jgi:cephalosporin hydroxylase
MKDKLIAWARTAYVRFYTTPAVSRLIINQFTRLYYQTPVPVRTWHDTKWLGHLVLKNPLDLWNFQEILFERRPDVLIECGSAQGGSALYYASVFDLMGSGRVISIDVGENESRPDHDRITYLIGSSVSREVASRVRDEIEGCSRCMVVLDSDHSKDHVLRELRLYSEFVTVGDFLIVEDTCINGHPVSPQFGPGPMEAVREFLGEDERFISDPRDRKFLMTFNPNGYLRRVR